MIYVGIQFIKTFMFNRYCNKIIPFELQLLVWIFPFSHDVEAVLDILFDNNGSLYAVQVPGFGDIP